MIGCTQLNHPRRLVLVALACLSMIGFVSAQTVTIDFDTDAAGLGLLAPTSFSSTSALSSMYAPLGVHFVGPGLGHGGGILNDSSGFGVTAQSGSNFLAFDRNAIYPNGREPKDPENISFDVAYGSVTISVAAGTSTATFEMLAFDSNDVQVAVATVTTAGFAPLTVTHAAGILRVEVRELGTDDTFVFDDLVLGPFPVQAPEFVRGDCNSDVGVSLPDAVVLLNHLFPQAMPLPLDCVDACDANDDGALNLVDAIAILNALFGSPTIPLPAPSSCGVDPTTTDSLDCAASPCP